MHKCGAGISAEYRNAGFGEKSADLQGGGRWGIILFAAEKLWRRRCAHETVQLCFDQSGRAAYSAHEQPDAGSGRFSSKVRLKNGAKSALLAQVRDVMGLDMQCGSKVTVTVEGKDEEAAVAAIQNYFVDHL